MEITYSKCYLNRSGDREGPLQKDNHITHPWYNPSSLFQGKYHLRWRCDGGFKLYKEYGESVLDLVQEIEILH